jgi:hypothetical protein
MTRSARNIGIALAIGAAGLVAWPFFGATTFIGDDHVFLAFARHAPNPLWAFVRDQHGGEFYRPVPMLVWWVLGRAFGGASWPFAALALALHVATATLLGVLLVGLGRSRPTGFLAAALFLLAPQNTEAAYWYAANTDLLATTFTLAALVVLLGRSSASMGASAVLALIAYLSKESALILPALALVVLSAAPAPSSWRRRSLRILPHAGLAIAVVVMRRRVLGGWGGPGDPSASLGAKLLQIANGLVHVGTGSDLLPVPLAWGLGVGALALLIVASARAGWRGRTRAPWAPLIFTALALVPLAAAGWIVGARYFYLPAAGLAWAAAEALAGSTVTLRVGVCAALLAIGTVAAAGRRPEIAAYTARVAAARRAVADGARAGYRVFHIAGGVKDLDLAVKEDPALAVVADELLVLGDVPASFALVPPALAARAGILIASPPLPPAGAYVFGDRRIVGLARRGDDPTLDEVIARFPDIRFIRLRPTPGGHVVPRDVTDELKTPSD